MVKSNTVNSYVLGQNLPLEARVPTLCHPKKLIAYIGKDMSAELIIFYDRQIWGNADNTKTVRSEVYVPILNKIFISADSFESISQAKKEMLIYAEKRRGSQYPQYKGKKPICETDAFQGEKRPVIFDGDRKLMDLNPLVKKSFQEIYSNNV